MRRCGRLLALVLLAFLVVPASALAAGATLTFTPPTTASFAVTLNGADQTATYSLAIPVSYTSNAGNKFATNGWNITATSTTLKGTNTGRTLSTNASSITAVSDSGCTGSPCINAVDTISYPLVIPAATAAPTALKVYSAQAGSGTGTNPLTMQVSVAIPANTYADTYTSTLTLSIAEGP